MSDASQTDPVKGNHPGSQPGLSEENAAPSAEPSWEDVEQELSLPDISTRSANQEPLTPDRSQTSSTLRSFDRSSPLIMVETAFLASAASLIWLVNFYFPLGPVLRVFFPIPIALIYLRWGSRAAWMGALVSGLLLSVLMGPPRSLLFIMPFGLMGVLLGQLWRRRASWAISITLGSILGAFGFFFRVWLVSLLLGDDLWQYATIQATDLVDRICVFFNILFQPSLGLVQAIVILMVILSNIVYLFAVHLVAWLLLDRLGNPIPRPPKWVQVLMEYEE
ncbi:DUF2232 domain-containing protein [Leptodesmis sichuanensis]|uniref:DUF2232 domain-containing protein n=2 Tax=Leptodesmis TaxID=2664261 RepID=UPI001F41EB49|nr:DUF2232 domain-containing protein [Leptodesmis sichuanensis]UIE37179.1 DUF2232 domain-containing protein [Leptodesmis sichuanensis A121]